MQATELCVSVISCASSSVAKMSMGIYAAAIGGGISKVVQAKPPSSWHGTVAEAAVLAVDDWSSHGRLHHTRVACTTDGMQGRRQFSGWLQMARRFPKEQM